MPLNYRTSASKRFIEFLDHSASVFPILPAVHTTNVAAFGDILDQNKFSVRHCKVYRTPLCYLFYGKPSYQIRKKTPGASRILGDAAVCFVLRIDALPKLARLFAVDTGAYFGHRYDDYLPGGICIDDFEMPATVAYLSRLVGAIYGSNEAYYHGEPNNSVNISPLDRVSEVLSGLCAASFSGSFDERCCSCEIQIDCDIQLESSILETIVVPAKLLDDPLVLDACRNRWNIKPICYRFKRATPEARTEVICEKLGDYYSVMEYL